MRIVPMGMNLGSWSLQRTLENNMRRLEVLRSCVGFIFDNKISDARIVSMCKNNNLRNIILFIYFEISYACCFWVI